MSNFRVFRAFVGLAVLAFALAAIIYCVLRNRFDGLALIFVLAAAFFFLLDAWLENVDEERSLNHTQTVINNYNDGTLSPNEMRALEGYAVADSHMTQKLFDQDEHKDAPTDSPDFGSILKGFPRPSTEIRDDETQK